MMTDTYSAGVASYIRLSSAAGRGAASAQRGVKFRPFERNPLITPSQEH